jgi:selenium-dependent xanthine dehydrogenase
MNENAPGDSENIELHFTLDGSERTVSTHPKRSVLDLLREEFDTFSLKPGCSPQGICGCCVALINGKPRVTCTLPCKTLAGKEVQTQASLSPEDAAIFQEAFATGGGTQCGYCTPGIVMQAKALLDKDPDPDDAAIKKALNMHICRCTGWVKIHDSIHMAAEMRRAELKKAPPPQLGKVGDDWRQRDIHSAILGKRPYIDDMRRPGLLHGALVWTPHPRCLVNKIDSSAAEAMPGVVRICTAKDLPGDRKVGLIFRDWPVLIAEGEETRCVADILAVVIADSPKEARAAAEAVVVDAEKLVAMTDVKAAAELPENVLATSRVLKGEGETALADCAHVIEESFVTQVIDQAFLEPESSLAVPDADGGFTVYSCGQGVFDDRIQLCALFDMPEDLMRIVLVPTGGAFGAKEDLNVQPHAILAAKLTGRPVKISLNMAESTRYHPKRHALFMDYTVGADENGHIQVVKARILGDTGGYASVGDKVLERAAGHAAGPYRVAHVDVEAHTIYTNNPVCGAMRGFGVNQVAFALEGCLDRLAEKLDLDPLELRARNLLGAGDVFATGQVMNEGCGIVRTLEAIRPHYDRARAEGKHVGIACGMKNVGMGNGLKEVGRVELHVRSDSEVRLYTGFTEMGQGHDTVMAQMASEATGLPAAVFTVECSTRVMVETGMTTASRGTYLGGNAVKVGCEGLTAALRDVGGDLGRLVGRIFKGEWWAPETHTPEQGTAMLKAGTGTPVTHYAFGFATQLAIIDTDGKLEEVVAAHDVGRAINRVSCEGQIEGGVHMGIGYGLSEELIIDDEGWPDVRFVKLGIIKDRHMPKITTLLVEHPDPSGPWGAKGVGEIGLVPTAPAIAAACHSFDGTWRTKLPMRETAAAKAMGVRMPKAPKKR